MILGLHPRIPAIVYALPSLPLKVKKKRLVRECVNDYEQISGRFR